MENKVVKIAAIQMDCSKDAETNTANAVRKIEQAVSLGANIICLPELFQHVYFPAKKADKAAFELAEVIPGKTTQLLSELAKKHKVYIVGGSIYERAEENGQVKYYNTAVTFDDEGKLISSYRKCHIPQDEGFYEKEYFEQGDEIKVIDTKYGKIAVLICYDQWYPEAARKAVLQGAQVLIYPTAIGYPEGVENITGDWRKKWRMSMRGHAVVNDVYVVAINRVGHEDLGNGVVTDFFGGSFIADFAGKIIVSADKSSVVIAENCDLELQQKVQKAWNFLPNRRPDLYSDLVKKTNSEGLLER